MNELDLLCQRIASDAAFVTELAADPQATLKKNNMKVSDEVLETMKGMDEAGLREIASNYDSDKAAC
ncbi:MAG: hypothetical protein ABI986_04655 [Chloroflexota bacterium]